MVFFCLSATRTYMCVCAMVAGGQSEKIWQSLCTEGPKQGRDVEKKDGKTLTMITLCECVCACMHVCDVDISCCFSPCRLPASRRSVMYWCLATRTGSPSSTMLFKTSTIWLAHVCFIFSFPHCVLYIVRLP